MTYITQDHLDAASNYRAAQRAIKRMTYEDVRRELATLDRAIFNFDEALPPLGDEVDVSDMTAAEAAFTIWRVIIDYCRKAGESMAWEVMILDPAAAAEHAPDQPLAHNWRVSFESGPGDWGIRLSTGGQPFPIRVKGIINARGFIAEPYYSFDLCFDPQV